MNSWNQRLFDKFAARVLRKGVSGVRRITDIIRKPVTTIPKNPERILVIKLWGLGALVCATPALRVLRQRFPTAQITLLTAKGLDTLYDGAGLYDRVIPWDASSLRALPRTVRRYREAAREEEFDLALNLDGLNNLSALLALVSGARATVGFVPRGGRRRRGYTIPLPIDLSLHATRLFLQLTAAVDATSKNRALVPPPVRTSEREQAGETLREWGVDEDTYLVGINMNSSEFAMRRAWPAEKFVLLAQSLEEMGEYRTVFIGSAEEERFVLRHVKHMDTPPLSLTGCTSVRQLAALLTHFHLFISNDSGPLHLAAALNVPTVSFFGPESPERFGPPRNEKHAVFWRRPRCGPCVSFLAGSVSPCHLGDECLREISIEAVLGVVNDMLDHLADPEAPPWLEAASK